MTAFGEYACFYDLLYREKDYQREVTFVCDLIKQYCPKASTILELGCGTGIHATILAQRGFCVHGVDRSPEMLHRAHMRSSLLPQKTAGLLSWTKADLRSLEIGRRFDVVLAIFHVMSYLQTDEDMQAAFDTARAHLHHNGIFVFDCWYGPTVLSEQPKVSEKRVVDQKIDVIRVCEPIIVPNQNTVVCKYTILIQDIHPRKTRVIEEYHRMRYFFQPEIEGFARRTGMQLLKSAEWLTDRNLGENTFSACFVCRKGR